MLVSYETKLVATLVNQAMAQPKSISSKPDFNLKKFHNYV